MIKSDVTDGIKYKLPMRSISSIFCFQVRPWPSFARRFEKINPMISSASPPIGILIMKHHLQARASVSLPPIMGATMMATPPTAPNRLIKTGRFRKGIICVMMVKAPEIKPAPPMPATVLPAINIGDVAAFATIKEPRRKIANEIMYMILIENRWYIFPKANWNALAESLYTAAYQPTSATVWK